MKAKTVILTVVLVILLLVSLFSQYNLSQQKSLVKELEHKTTALEKRITEEEKISKINQDTLRIQLELIKDLQDALRPLVKPPEKNMPF